MSARVGAVIAALNATPSEAALRAQVVERLGYEAILITQLLDARDIAIVLAAYASATSRVRLVTAVLPIHSRHPTAMVQMAATLDELSEGRFALGIGIGHQITVEATWGKRWPNPVDAMREYLAIVRHSLRDGSCEVAGEHFTARWSYGAPRRPGLPIYLGAIGPRMLELAGEFADGVVLWLCSPGYVRSHVIPHIRLGRQRAGRDLDGFEIMALIPVGLSSDLEAGYGELRQIANPYLQLPSYRRMLTTSGYAKDVAAGSFSNHTLMQLSGFGAERAVHDIQARYRSAGCTLPVVWPFWGYRGSPGLEAVLQSAIAA
jgi:alkanesulfonate monooxygenase SsuD/methylene tetrahydromethanopterin reductase-like flavin-dependent oxidoreductase (luciferase family)